MLCRDALGCEFVLQLAFVFFGPSYGTLGTPVAFDLLPCYAVEVDVIGAAQKLLSRSHAVAHREAVFVQLSCHHIEQEAGYVAAVLCVLPDALRDVLVDRVVVVLLF